MKTSENIQIQNISKEFFNIQTKKTKKQKKKTKDSYFFLPMYNGYLHLNVTQYSLHTMNRMTYYMTHV